MRHRVTAVNSTVRRPAAASCAAWLSSALLITGCSASAARQPSTQAAWLTSRHLPPHVFRVPSGSMEPTLPIGSRVVVGKSAPFVEAIVVNHPPELAEQQECGPKPHVIKPGGAACDVVIPRESSVDFVKRIVAGPGDEIYVRAGHVYRKANGTTGFLRERDPYIRACGTSTECNFPDPIRIPAGKWFLMGDDRGESDDSRFWGPVPTAWIVGVVTKLECPRFEGRLIWIRRVWREGCPRGG